MRGVGLNLRKFCIHLLALDGCYPALFFFLLFCDIYMCNTLRSLEIKDNSLFLLVLRLLAGICQTVLSFEAGTTSRM